MNIFRIVVFFLESEINEKFHSLFSERFFVLFLATRNIFWSIDVLNIAARFIKRQAVKFFSCQRVVGSI